MLLKNYFLYLFRPLESNNYRPKLLHFDVLFTLSLTLIGFSIFLHQTPVLNFTLGNILGYSSEISVDKVIVQVNQQRASAGLPVMSSNPQLTLAAEAKAQDMFANQYWAHTSPSGVEPWNFVKNSGYKYHLAGENLARDFSMTDNMVEAWMQSPSHRANIMNTRYIDTGVAVTNGVLNGVETTLVVQLFGTPQQIQPRLAETAAVNAVNPQFEVTTSLDLPSGGTQSGVLASITVPETQLMNASLISPTKIFKSFILGVLTILSITLLLDLYSIGAERSLRSTGKNLAHILFLGAVAFMIVLFKSGTVG